VSAPDLALAALRADILEVAAFAGAAPELVRRAGEAGWALPPLGRVSATPAGLALAVRPERWLMVLAPQAGGTSAAHWQGLLGTSGAVIEQSAGLAAFFLSGAPAREVLSRGCRLDLDPEVFPPGSAAATQIAQVAVTLAALPGGLLLLTPASTARHLREWLLHVGRPFGIAAVSDVTVAAWSEIRSA
jgi:heterotetrameric sarcosine oxidase gamma subunit